MKNAMILTMTIPFLLLTTKCGIELPEELQNDAALQTDQSEDSAEMFQLSDESDYSEDGELGEEEKGFIDSLRALQKSAHMAVAECAGFSAEADAFEAKKDELIASGTAKEDLRESLKTDHEALREVMKGLHDEIEQCKEELKDSETVTTIRTVIEACWDKPERGDQRRPKKAKQGFGLERPQHDEGREMDRKGGRMGPKGKPRHLPPKEFANFDTAECQEASALLSTEG